MSRREKGTRVLLHCGYVLEASRWPRALVCATRMYHIWRSMYQGSAYRALAHGTHRETRTIKSHFTCNTKNLIYMIQCNRCNLQYIGETKDVWKHYRTVDISNNTSTILDKIVETLNYKLTAPPPPTPMQCCLRILIIDQHCNGGGRRGGWSVHVDTNCSD